MTAPTLSQFTAHLRNKDIARPTHYYVEIVPPPIFVGKYNDKFSKPDSNLISMWCSQAMTPQVTIDTRDEYLENGVKRKYAFDQDYQNLTLHFYADQEYNIKQFFDEWKYSIVPQRRKFNYSADYTAETLNLFILDQAETATYKYEYSRIFPKSVNAIDLSYNSGGSVSTFSVDFVFEEVYYTNLLTGKTSKPDVELSRPPSSPNKEVEQSITPLDLQGNIFNLGT